MAHVVIGQVIKFRLDSNEALTGGSHLIKYKKPNGAIGQWTATIDGTYNTRAYYITDTTDLDIAGDWRLWLKTTRVDGSIGYGKPVAQRIDSEGDI